MTMKLSSRWRCARQTADGGGELGARVDTICILLFHQKYYLACEDFLVLGPIWIDYDQLAMAKNYPISCFISPYLFVLRTNC